MDNLLALIGWSIRGLVSEKGKKDEGEIEDEDEGEVGVEGDDDGATLNGDVFSFL